MSGHSKWAQIKHKKAKTDAQKSKVFSKFAKLISIETRKARGDTSNPALKAVIERAKQENMPNDSIERAVKKATGADTCSLETIIYEAYGPGGVALIIEALTDNRNKAAQEVKHILTSEGYVLASTGSAMWAFGKKDGSLIAETTIPLSDEDAGKLAKLVDKLEDSEEVQNVYTNAE